MFVGFLIARFRRSVQSARNGNERLQLSPRTNVPQDRNAYRFAFPYVTAAFENHFRVFVRRQSSDFVSIQLRVAPGN